MTRQEWTLTRETGPTSRAVTVDQLKSNLNISSENDVHDVKLGDAIDAATEQFEADTDRICLAQTFVLHLDEFTSSPIDLMKSPTQSITEIGYVDDDGDDQVVDPSVYQLDSGRNQVYLARNQAWPAMTKHQNAVSVTFIAGVDTASQVPREYKQAIILQASAWWVDPAMENPAANANWLNAYERLIRRLIQTKEV